MRSLRSLDRETMSLGTSGCRKSDKFQASPSGFRGLFSRVPGSAPHHGFQADAKTLGGELGTCCRAEGWVEPFEPPKVLDLGAPSRPVP